jgi:hypothetical protein
MPSRAEAKISSSKMPENVFVWIPGIRQSDRFSREIIRKDMQENCTFKLMLQTGSKEATLGFQ